MSETEVDLHDIGPTGRIARVHSLSDDRFKAVLKFPNGTVTEVDVQEPFPIDPGTVVILDSDRGQLRVVAENLWEPEDFVGVVRLRHADVTLIDVNGRVHRVATIDSVPYREGNTVEATEHGVTRVLSQDPIRYFDLPTITESTIDEFLVATPESDDQGLDFDSFGGMADVVKRARELIETPLRKHDMLQKIGAKAITGVLLTGPPGTGKTMLARIIASRAKAYFYEVSGPVIASQWYGQSEELLRSIFKAARAKSRSIIFFDEIDSVAGHRDDAHEASKRIVAQLLVLMDGFKTHENVVVIATTNRPQDIDIALLRPGRFDWRIDFPAPTLTDREEILRVSSSPIHTFEPLPYAWAAEKTEGWSAAELTAIWNEAALLAVSDERDVIVGEDFVEGLARVARQRSHSKPIARA